MLFWTNSSKKDEQAFNCEANLSFEGVSSDYRIVTTKIRQSLRRNTTQATEAPHYDWFLFNNRDISDKCSIILTNKFDTLQEISETLTPNDEYENFVNLRMEAAAECIPIKTRPKHWVSWEILAVKKKGDNVKTASLCNKKNPTNLNSQKLKKA